MKSTIQINKKWWNIWPTLTRNQILLSIIMLLNEVEDYEKYIFKVYRFKFSKSNNKKIFFKDYIIIKEISKDIHNFNIINDDINVKDYVNLGGYTSLKMSSFDKLIDSKLNKEQTLVFLWIIDLYSDKRRDNKIRYFNFKISDVLRKIFITYNNPRLKRKLFLQTLELLKSWSYNNVDILIKDFKVSGLLLDLFLDSKSHDYHPRKRPHFKKY